MAFISSMTPQKKKSTFAGVGPPNTPERETEQKSPSERKNGNNNSEKHPKPKPTRKNKKEESTMPSKNSVKKGRIEERKDQERKQGGLEKEVGANWMEGTKQERKMERGKKEDTRETKRQS